MNVARPLVVVAERHILSRSSGQVIGECDLSRQSGHGLLSGSVAIVGKMWIIPQRAWKAGPERFICVIRELAAMGTSSWEVLALDRSICKAM